MSCVPGRTHLNSDTQSGLPLSLRKLARPPDVVSCSARSVGVGPPSPPPGPAAARCDRRREAPIVAHSSCRSSGPICTSKMNSTESWNQQWNALIWLASATPPPGVGRVARAMLPQGSADDFRVQPDTSCIILELHCSLGQAHRPSMPNAACMQGRCWGRLCMHSSGHLGRGAGGGHQQHAVGLADTDFRPRRHLRVRLQQYEPAGGMGSYVYCFQLKTDAVVGHCKAADPI